MTLEFLKKIVDVVWPTIYNVIEMHTRMAYLVLMSTLKNNVWKKWKRLEKTSRNLSYNECFGWFSLLRWSLRSNVNITCHLHQNTIFVGQKCLYPGRHIWICSSEADAGYIKKKSRWNLNNNIIIQF